MTLDSNNKVVITNDGSSTLYNQNLCEHYHSTYGAIQESNHVFIQSGLELFKYSDLPVNIFEVGFGTGLNALLSYAWAENNNVQVNYQCVELYPIPVNLAKLLNYPELLKLDRDLFLKMHQTEKEKIKLSGNFNLQKLILSMQEVDLPHNIFDLVFFDAFSPDVQPEMWSENIFKKIARSMKRGGALTTYSCRGIVKRALKSAGFKIEKLAGPPGKREIIRSFKL